MNRHFRGLLTLCVLVAVPLFVSADEPTRIAVMEMQVSTPQSGSFAKKLAQEIRVSLGRLPSTAVLTDKQLAASAKSMGFDPAYADVDTAAAELGKKIEVDFLVMGNAVRVGKIHKVTVRFLQVGTAQSGTTKGDVEDSKKSKAQFAQQVADEYRGFTRFQAERHYQMALQYLQSGDYVNALRGFQQSSAIDPSYVAALVGEVTCHYSLDSLTQAEALVDSAIAMDPSFGQSFYYKAVLLQKRDRCEEALPFFSKALAADSSYTPVYFNWAQCLRSLGRSDEATDLLHQAMTYTDDIAYVASLARLYEDLGMIGDAFKIYVSVVERDSTYSFAWRRIVATGSDYLVVGDFGRAGQDTMGFTRPQIVDLVRRGIGVVIDETGVAGASVYKYLGKALEDTGDDRGALEIYQEWERLDPENIEPIQLQVPIFARAGRQEQAIKRLHDVVKRSPDNVNAMAFLALALADVGRLDQARNQIGDALRKGPSEPIVLMAAGEIKERESERKEQAARDHVKDKNIDYVLRYDQAEKMFDEAIVMVRQAKDYFERARQLFRAGNDTERAQYVEKKSKQMDSEVERLEATKIAVIYAGE
ncbi:tetratricopeptide repeat protein [Candidatus Fermentibacteria bacterium]|nr:tetratricopeptide repeat protein [Candidatus Fermentibacteria bacterium]